MTLVASSLRPVRCQLRGLQLRAFSLECSKTRRRLRKSRWNLPGVLSPGKSTRAADLDSIPLQPEDCNFAGKEGVASELHLTRPIPRLLSGISVKFLKLPGKPAVSWEADIPGGLRVQEAPAARFLFKAWDWVREAFCGGPGLSWSSQPFTAAGFKAGERAKREPPV